MEQVVLGFGSNLGARAAYIDAALALLSGQPGLVVERVSRLYETPPLGPPQPHYLNAAALVRYAGSLEGLLAITQRTECLLGRTRDVRWGPRTLDIDLLSRAGGPYHARGLTLPHPGLYERGFALAPLCDVEPAWEPLDRHRAIGPHAEPLAHAPVTLTKDGGAHVVTAGHAAEGCARVITSVVEIACPWSAVGPPDAVLPFEARGAALADALDVLAGRVVALTKAGFSVHSGVVRALGTGSLSGLFLGTHVGAGRALSRPAVELARGPSAPHSAFSARIFLP